MNSTVIEGCFLLEAPIYKDHRGAFSETYKKSLFSELNLPEMVQDNHLVTRKGGIRAMHWQTGEHAQAKLVNVIEGLIFDVVFDLRRESKSFGTFATFELGVDSPMLFVPKGCAHGFQSVSELSIVHYKTDNEYHADSQRAFIWNDSTVGIPWPIKDALVSDKDSLAPHLQEII